MSLKNKKGLTLVEIIVSIAILGIIVTPLASLFVNTVRNNAMARDKMIANQLAQKYMEIVIHDIKKDGATPTYDSSWQERGFEIEPELVLAKSDYGVSNTSGSASIDDSNVEIEASSSLANGDEIEIKDNKIKLNGVIGNYSSDTSNIKIKITNIEDLDISINVTNQSSKKVSVYRVYDEDDTGKIDIRVLEGEVYVHGNIYENNEGSSESENKNYLYKIVITVSKDGKELTKLASYKTND